MAVFSIQGIGLSAYSLTDYEGPNLPNLLLDAASDGANFAVLSNIAQIDLTTGAISDYAITEPDGSVFDETAKFSDIGSAIAAAEAQGLQVMLKPQIGAVDGAAGFGNLTDPNEVIADPAAFFASYQNYILQWAELAQQYHVPVLSIGNEMLAATKPQYTSYWDDLIAAVRQVYSGELTYSALLPLQASATAYNEVQQIQFWDKLDFAGFDVYPSLTTQLNPTVAQLNAAWQKTVVGGQTQTYVQEISDLAQSVGKPVLFTETGVASFPGANDRYDHNDSSIGLPNTKSDYQNQANWWASFFDTWGANPPSWLAGIFAYNNTPGDTGSYYTTGYDIDGKPAESVLASWYGGGDYLNWAQTSFTGSTFNDQIYLYGDGVPVAAYAPTSQPQTFSTQVAVTINGTIIKGVAPTVHFYVNGTDEGAQTLSPTPATYVDPNGVIWSVPQTFAFNLNGLVNVNEIEVAIDSAVDVGGPENAQIDISAATVNGVALTQGTYFPLSGGSQQAALGSNTQYDGGYELIDPTPWNNQLTGRSIGTASNPFVINGGGGTDTVHVLGTRSDYTIVHKSKSIVDLSENSSLDQDAVLHNIAFIAFQDGSLLQLASITVTSGSTYTVPTAQSDSGDVVLGGGSLVIDSGGSESALNVRAAGSVVIQSGGSASGTILHGSAEILGTDSGAQIGAGGTATIGSGGVEGGATIGTGGIVSVGAGGTVSSAAINGGTLDVLSGGTADEVIAGRGTLSVAAGAVTGNMAVTFVGSGGALLSLAASGDFSGTVAGLAEKDKIDLADIGSATVQTPTYVGTSSGGTLTVTDGIHTANIALLGNYLGSLFVAKSDGHGGTLIETSAHAANAAHALAPPHA